MFVISKPDARGKSLFLLYLFFSPYFNVDFFRDLCARDAGVVCFVVIVRHGGPDVVTRVFVFSATAVYIFTF